MEKIQPEKVVELMRKYGEELTPEQAKLILEFLRKLAEIAITQYLNS
jgi:uncharacterized protein (DUF697 family)